MYRPSASPLPSGGGRKRKTIKESVDLRNPSRSLLSFFLPAALTPTLNPKEERQNKWCPAGSSLTPLLLPRALFCPFPLLRWEGSFPRFYERSVTSFFSSGHFFPEIDSLVRSGQVLFLLRTIFATIPWTIPPQLPPPSESINLFSPSGHSADNSDPKSPKRE